MARLLTHPITGAITPRSIAAYLREPMTYLEFVNTVTVAAPDPYTYWTIKAVGYAIVAGDVLRYDVWVDPFNPGLGAGAVELYLAFTPFVASAAAAAPVVTGAWVSVAFDLSALAANVILTATLANLGDGVGTHRARYRNIRITDAPGTTLRYTIWSTGDPEYNMVRTRQSNANENATAYDAPGWTGDPATVTLAFGTEAAWRDGIQHEAGLAIFPETSDAASDTGIQAGGSFKAEIVAGNIADPRTILGKVFELSLVSQVSEAGIVVREIIESRRAKVAKAQLSRNILSLDFVDVTDLTLDALHPSETYTVADYAGLFEGHVGKVINDGVGLLRRVPMVWIKKAGGDFRHAICKKRTGYTYAVQAIYRGDNAGDIGAVVPAAEYTQGVSTGAVSALDVVDVGFTNEQLNFSNQPYSLSADILVSKGAGVTDASLASEEIKYLLNSKGLTADAASFATAATYGDTNKMRVAAGYIKPTKLRAILTDLAFVARAMLTRGASGRFAILQDRPGAAAGTWLEESDSINIEPVQYSDKPAKVILSYRPARSGTEEYLATPAQRLPAGSRPDIEYHCPYISDHETADRTVDYYSKRDSVGQSVSASIHGVQLDPRELITITGSGAWTGDLTWRITEVRRPADRNDLTLELYDAAIHTYVAAALPAGATNVYTPDYSETAPLAPTTLAVISNVTAIDDSGKAFTAVNFSAAPPALNWAGLYARFKNNVTNELSPVFQLALDTGVYKTTVGHLQPNTSHTLQVWARNSAELDGAVATLAVNTVAYTGAPPTPTLSLATQPVGNVIVFGVDAPSYPHHAAVVWELQTAGGGFVVQAGESGVQLRITSVSYGTLYQARAKFKDLSGNVSTAYSGVANLTPAASISDSHITPLGVGTGSLAGLGVTNGKVASAAVTQGKISWAAQSVSASVGAGAYVSFGGAEFMIDTRFQADAADVASLPLYPGKVGGSPYRYDTVGVTNVSGAAKTFTLQYVQIIL